MASYNSKNRDTEYTRVYKSTKGMDLTGATSPTEHYRSVINMFVDYEGGGSCLESLPGYRKLCNLGGRINGMYRHKCAYEEYLIVHAGNVLYKARITDIDSPNAFSSISVINDKPSSGFTYQDRLFILDGESIYVIDGNLALTALSSLGGYVPTTYLNGERYEKRNMLSKTSLERYTISSSDDYLYESLGFKYSVLDTREKTCAIAGFSGTAYGALYVPRYANIGGVRYEIAEISDYALRNQTHITALFTSAGLKRVGRSALRGCTALETVQLSTTVETIDEYCFYGCSKLARIYFGESMSYIGGAAFGYCTAFSQIYYERDLTGYNAISGLTSIPDSVSVQPFLSYSAVRLGFPVCGSVLNVDGVYLNDNPISYQYERSRDTVYLDFDATSECDGGDFKIFVSNDPSNDEDDFSASTYFSATDERSAILGCTTGAVFNGRIFLSGNPKLPGAVFYSGIDLTRNHNYTYFRECDYFIDGEGAEGVSSMLALTDSLLVFRRGNNSAGSIFYHKISSDGKYPVYYIHRGVSILSKSYILYDDALFLSPDGICTILKQVYADYNKLSTCSQGIIGDLNIRDDTRFDFAVFKGYMVVIIGDRMYLGDLKRSYKLGTETSYEWYKTVGIGDYEDDRTVYRYSEAYEGLDEFQDRIGERAEGTVISRKTESGASVYYVETDGKKYAVMPTSERTGGMFYPATALFTIGEKLFFGTESGAVCVFNTDKRGESGVLSPEYYSFMGHAPLCEIETFDDNLDTQSLTKETVKGSFGLTLQSVGECLPTLFVSTDGSEYKPIPFAKRRYGLPSRFKVLAEEAEKGYIEKRLKISSEEYLSPFGVYSLEYRYKIKGRMKK